jgi:diadenosine tetraphosphate (Ap4A) HIT family hydrolase
VYGAGVKWPDSFYELRRGLGCPMCLEGRPDVTDDGIRFYSGLVTDAYLRRTNVQRGLTVVIWRGRHVAEPTALEDDEAGQYLREVLAVGRALEQAFHPVKLNYNVLGNALPHLHTHIVPRYADDPRPGWPFPFPADESPPIPLDLLMRDVDALRATFDQVDKRG